MAEPESTSIPHPHRLDPHPGPGDRGSSTIPHASASDGTGIGSSSTAMNPFGITPAAAVFDTRTLVPDDATRRVGLGVNASSGNFTKHDHPLASGSGDSSQPTNYPTPSAPERRLHPGDTTGYPPQQLPNSHSLALSRSNSQGTASTNGADPVFTPPTSGGRLSPGTGSAHGSSQESSSQLHRLSQIAAAQARIPEDATADMADMIQGPSRKRMADGAVKHARSKSNVSPGQAIGHSRNTSTVSVASTAGSRIGELSAELRARLSYAMVKVNHGWQSHTIDQVETLASQAASPVSSSSTVHLRNGSSTSPRLSAGSHRDSNNTTPATGPQPPYPGRSGEPQWRTSPRSTSRGSSTSPVKASHGLAPPVSIHPSQHMNPRRESNPRHVPSFLSHHTSPHLGAGHTSPYVASGRPRTISDAMLVSPHTNVREQDAIESLLFMSSPGNSANLKHAFPPSSSQPLPSTHNNNSTPQRTALPNSQPRKSLPSGRPPTHARSQSHSQPHTQKRVGFEKSPSTMDIDDPPFAGSPMSVSRGTPRRRINGDHSHQSPRTQPYLHSQNVGHTAPTPRMKQLPVSAGLTVSSKPRQTLGDEEIDRMLERAAAVAEGESDSDGEIELPRGRGGEGVVGV